MKKEAVEPKPVDEARERTYYSISEVAERLDIRPHVLRYWETQFSTLHPRKGRSGSRMYREKDLETLERIKTLLYEKGFTIKGARRRLRLEQRKEQGEGQMALGIENPWLDGIVELREELVALLEVLRGKRRSTRWFHPRWLPRPALPNPLANSRDTRDTRIAGFVPETWREPNDEGRGVAQPGSALAWGASGRWFKSSRPDHSFPTQSPRDPNGHSAHQ